MIATGISAAPMELVIFHPRAKEETVAHNNKEAPIPVLSVESMAINAKRFKPAKGLLRYLFIGSYNVNFIPESFIKAAMEPVKVIPPITVPK